MAEINGCNIPEDLYYWPEKHVWARPEEIAKDTVLQHQSIYLNTGFFWLRVVLYFGIWAILAFFLNRWSRAEDRAGEASWKRKLRALSGPALVIYVLTVTFSSIDWVMSIDPHWFSTIFGIVFVIGQALLTLAFAVIVLAMLRDRKPLSEVLGPQHFHDLGNLLLAFVMLWAYISFSQFLIIWSGNLPEEIPWYLARLQHGWGVIAFAIVAFHFAVPFIVLLARGAKRKAQILVKVAVAIAFMRFVDLFWIVSPSFGAKMLSIHWMDLLAPIGIGGIWIAVFIWQLKSRPLLPLHDARLKEAFQHE